jgi:hypothetical protein
LDVLSTRRLASALFGDRLSQPGVVRLAAMSDGNPLLLRELARAALAQNLIARHGAGWRMGAGIPVSDALRELVARRLVGQPDDGRRALELIALAEPARLDAVERIVPADDQPGDGVRPQLVQRHRRTAQLTRELPGEPQPYGPR